MKIRKKSEGFSDELSFIQIYDKIFKKFSSCNDLSFLEEEERFILLSEWFTRETNGSGIESIFFGSVANHFDDLLKMLSAVKAENTFKYLKVIESFFGDKGIPKKQEERIEVFVEIQETNDLYFDTIEEINDFILFSGDEIVGDLLISELLGRGFLVK